MNNIIQNNLMKRAGALAFGFALLASFTSLAFPAQAYEIQELDDKSIIGDFVIGPAKAEVVVEPGTQKTLNIIVTNRMGDERVFNLSVEDFTGSRNAEEPVVLLGDERGPYSLKDYLSFAEKSFVLKHGQRATIPVTISIPVDSEPGGRYGSVLVTTTSKPAEGETVGATTGGATIVSRIGALFFVRIPGVVAEDGELQSFTVASDKKFFLDGPVPFHLLYENNGSVYLNPYGEITIKNMLGETVGGLKVEPWFAMPDSLRLREVSWDRDFLLGRYTAEAKINRGYGDIIDEASVTFWVVPIKLVLSVFVGLLLLLLIIRFIGSRFEFRRK
ncbi:MAG: hypothetical protein AAB523_01400 [Patescibacteria group bacterium]